MRKISTILTGALTLFLATAYAQQTDSTQRGQQKSTQSSTHPSDRYRTNQRDHSKNMSDTSRNGINYHQRSSHRDSIGSTDRTSDRKKKNQSSYEKRKNDQ